MIEVLNHGSNYNERVCPNCDCRFKYDDSDIQNIETEQSYEDFYIEDSMRVVKKKSIVKFLDYYIECPECKSSVFIKRTTKDGRLICINHLHNN